jgi:Acetyltransferase (GNAT) family
MVQSVMIRREMAAGFSDAQTFYACVGYSGIVTTDCIVVSAKCGDNIVGVVRLAPENGVLVLRGMMIAPSYQRQRIGTRMLWEVSKVLGARECFCLPHAWLEGFYGVSNLPRFKMTTLHSTFGKDLPNTGRQIRK